MNQERPTCDLCNMYFDADIFWEWHKLEGHMVMCRNGGGKTMSNFTEDRYWERTGTVDPDYSEWDFIDDNGDAFRIIYK
jgi:hypothetical protein